MPKQRTFNKTQFEKLCEIQCTKQEVCDWFGTTDKTIEAWIKRNYDNRGFSEVFSEKKGMGRVSLRRAQFRMAMKNVAMAIFLGKQWLGQTDVNRSDISIKDLDDKIQEAMERLVELKVEHQTEVSIQSEKISIPLDKETPAEPDEDNF